MDQLFFFSVNKIFLGICDSTLFLLKSDLQLGAGTSLPGLVAAKVGADVTLTDIAQNTEVS